MDDGEGEIGIAGKKVDRGESYSSDYEWRLGNAYMKITKFGNPACTASRA